MSLASIRRAAVGVGWTGVVAVVALIPAMGPMLDHHYAERQPGHGHLHLGWALSDHAHGHEMGHAHSHTHAAHSGTPSAGETPAGVVFIAAYSGAGPSRAYVSSLGSQVSLAIPEPAESLSLFSFAPDAGLRQQSFVKPPTQPPRS